MTELSGVIEKIIFHNEKNGYTVAIFETSDDSDQIGIQTTVTGILPHIKKGMPLKIKGNWTEHKTYGEQFNIESFKTIKPTNKKNLETFLLSGSVPGISKNLAKRIINTCGNNFMDIIETNPNELLKIKGLGKKTLQNLINCLRDQSENIEIIAQLQELGLSARLSQKILEHYKNETLNIVMNDPFDLALNINGIGFTKADEIAQRIGIETLNDKRIIAGIIYTIMDCYRSGHTYMEEDEIIEKSQSILDVPEDEIKVALGEAIFSGRIIQSYKNDKPIYYPTELYNAESDAALNLVNLSKDKVNDNTIDLNDLIRKTEEKLNIKLDSTQKEAITSVTQNPITIITGGPGTGKSATCSIVK